MKSYSSSRLQSIAALNSTSVGTTIIHSTGFDCQCSSTQSCVSWHGKEQYSCDCRTSDWFGRTENGCTERVKAVVSDAFFWSSQMTQLDISAILQQNCCRDILRKAAQAENTRNAYEKGWKIFIAWCEHKKIEPLKASTDDVIGFLVAMVSPNRPCGGKPLALSTLKLYRSALNDRWRQQGEASPAAERSVTEALQGLARLVGGEPRRVKAIRECQMRTMLDLCGDGLHGFRDAAILSLGFAAALRRSELSALRTENLQRKSSSKLMINIRQSKTDQQNIGQNVAVIDGKTIRPIQHLYRWLEASGIRTGYVFQTLQRGGKASGRPMDSGDIARIVKRYVRKAGFEPSEYSGHSLRAGFVTSAAVHHARIDKIMEITRHKSAETVLKYIRDEQSFVDHAGASFL